MADVVRALVPSLPQGWLLDASTSRQSPLNIAQALRLRGPLNLAALRESVELVIARYQELWNISGEVPDSSSDILPIQDFSSLPVDARESEARQYIHRYADRSLDLDGGPRLHASLVRLSAADNILLIGMHHSLCGAGVLLSSLIAELSAHYNAQVDSGSSPLPERAEQVPSAPAANGSFGAWKTHLKDAQDALEPPPIDPQPSSTSGGVGRESRMLPEALRASVLEFSKAQSVTPFTTLFAAFAALLSRHSGQHEFLVGVSTSNLEYPADHVSPRFPMLLPLQVDFSGDPSFREFLQRARRSLLEADAEARRPDGAPSQFDFLQVALILEHPAWETVHFSGLSVSAYDLDTRSTGLQLVLHFEEHFAGLLMTADYDASLFNPATIQRFVGHYGTLLASAISDPENSVSQLPLLCKPERRQLLDEWNAAAVREYPSDVSLPQLIEAQVEATPDAVAVEFDAASSSQQRLTYAQLNARSNRLAAHLRSLGVDRNTLVGVCLERSVDLLIALLAILKAGGAYLPLDPGHPDDHIGPIVENARLGILIGRPELAARLPNFSGELVLLDWEAFEDYPDTNQPVTVSDRDLAYVIYTSGSTGQPKGVMIPRRALNNLLMSVREWFHFGPRDVLLALTTIAFDIAGVDIWLPLLVGARLLMVDRATALNEHLLRRHHRSRRCHVFTVHPRHLEDAGRLRVAGQG